MAELCGKPTKSGEPCRAIPAGFYGQACSRHQTDDDRRVQQLCVAAWSAGRESGIASGIMNERDRVANLERNERIAAERAAERAAPFRLHTSDGRQIVVCEKLTWAWDGDDLQVGDVVSVPAPYWYGSHTRPQHVTVTAIGSSYAGVLQNILGLVRRAGVSA